MAMCLIVTTAICVVKLLQYLLQSNESVFVHVSGQAENL